MGASSMNIRNTESVHDFPRHEVLTAMRRVLDFLEATPDMDIPESMGELWVRTLARQNRGELKDKDSVTAWFERQMVALNPKPDDVFTDGETFGAAKDFGAGVRLSVYVGVSEVCHKTIDVKTVQRTEQVSENTWHCPNALLKYGFSPNQEKLRERDRDIQRFMRGAA